MPFDLHRQLQELYAGEDGQREVRINGSFVADVVRHGVIYEIQTRKLSNIKSKIASLLETIPIVVVYPVSVHTTIIHCDGADLHECNRRPSPKQGHALDAFSETVYLAHLLAHPNMALEIVLVDTEDIRIKGDPHATTRRRRRRRRHSEWTTVNRRLTAIHKQIRLDTPADGLQLLPSIVEFPFCTRDLADAAATSLARAQQILYTLFHMGALRRVRRTRSGWKYEPAQTDHGHPSGQVSAPTQ